MSNDDDETVTLPRDADERSLRRKYLVLTVALGVPLLLCFVFARNLYPFAASTMMKGGGDLHAGWTYHILRGETLTGEIIDLPAVKLTNSLSNSAWALVLAVVDNKIFTISSPHPANIALIAESGGVDKLPPARRVDDLLRAWGAIYNSRLPANSPRRLRAVRLEEYRWPGGAYRDYDKFIRSWRTEL
ncbi:MAG: hypothetical protein ACT4OT_01005 [Acidobacteriota bacterium]